MKKKFTRKIKNECLRGKGFDKNSPNWSNKFTEIGVFRLFLVLYFSRRQMFINFFILDT